MTHFIPEPMRDGDLTLFFHGLSKGDSSRGIVPQYSFRMRLDGITEDVGSIDLRISLTRALEVYGGNVGYRVAAPYRGRRLAARSLILIAGFAREIGMTILLITCDETNLASRRTCELGGAQLQAVKTADIPELGARSTCYYELQITDSIPKW